MLIIITTKNQAIGEAHVLCRKKSSELQKKS